MRTWEALADGMLDAAITARLEMTWAGRTDAQRCDAWAARQMVRIGATLKSISQGLGDFAFAFADWTQGFVIGGEVLFVTVGVVGGEQDGAAG